MILLIERWIQKSVDRLTREDVISFAVNNGISLTNEEATFIYTYIKQNWKEALTASDEQLLATFATFSSETKQKALDLLHFYRTKYGSYLR